MTRSCPYCDDVLAAEKYDDHLKDCIDASHLDPPAPPGRFVVYCQNRDCLLYKGMRYPDVGHAELVAFAHENRMRETHPAEGRHVCDVKDLNPDQTSLNSESATGTKEATRG